MKLVRSVLCFLFFIMAVPSTAVEPDEILSDPKLEERARALSANLRCLVCQNQSIDDSDAELAKDLRVLVRTRLTEGDTDAEVMEYVVSRYGDFVLLKPSFSSKNLILWLTPILVLLIGGIFALLKIKSRQTVKVVSGLSEDEKEKLKQILKD